MVTLVSYGVFRRDWAMWPLSGPLNRKIGIPRGPLEGSVFSLDRILPKPGSLGCAERNVILELGMNGSSAGSSIKILVCCPMLIANLVLSLPVTRHIFFQDVPNIIFRIKFKWCSIDL